MQKTFSKWIRWNDRAQLPGHCYPGVYAIAISNVDISGQPFAWSKCVVYVGMTNALGGLKSRLNQFHTTIHGKRGHGGAQRVRFKHGDYHALTPQLYVATRPFKCDVKSNTPADLRIMGEVAQYEYECWALYVEKFGRLPEFNDMKLSPKK